MTNKFKIGDFVEMINGPFKGERGFVEYVHCDYHAWYYDLRVTDRLRSHIPEGWLQLVEVKSREERALKLEQDEKWRVVCDVKPSWEIVDVIFNNPATIVFWSDGSKTIVKCKDEAFDEEKGLAMAISKKVLGNRGNYFNEFRKWLPENCKLDEDIIDAFNAVPGVYPVSPEELKDILDKGDEK